MATKDAAETVPAVPSTTASMPEAAEVGTEEETPVEVGTTEPATDEKAVVVEEEGQGESEVSPPVASEDTAAPATDAAEAVVAGECSKSVHLRLVLLATQLRCEWSRKSHQFRMLPSSLCT